MFHMQRVVRMGQMVPYQEDQGQPIKDSMRQLHMVTGRFLLILRVFSPSPKLKKPTSYSHKIHCWSKTQQKKE